MSSPSDAGAIRPVYRTSPPAKLNVFLEILARRDDGFHELDTVMIAIDWRDELQLQRTETPGISLHVDWIEGRDMIAAQLHVAVDDPLLDVPDGETNLVHRALVLVNEAIGYRGGWDVRLGKRIPSGAGMGGASSDAAATLRLARAALSNVASECAALLDDEKMAELAARLGSDVPFFLGNLHPCGDAEFAHASDSGNASLARALGRGERLTFYGLPQTHHFLVVYPAVALSTASVYTRAVPSQNPKCGLDAVNAFIRPNPNTIDKILYNALAGPASGLSPRIGEALECLRGSGTPSQAIPQHGAPCQSAPCQLAPCQMTGSGSACFAWLIPEPTPTDGAPHESHIQAEYRSGTAAANEAWVTTIRDSLSGGAMVQAVASCPAAPEIHIV